MKSNQLKLAKRLIIYLANFKKQIIIVIISAIGSTLFAINGPKILGMATNELAQSLQNDGIIDFNTITSILFLLLGLYGLSALFNYIQEYFVAGITQNIVRKMRNEVNHKLTKMSLKYYDDNSHGDILSRVTSDIDTISNTLQQVITQLITSMVTILGILFMMFSIDITLTFISLVTLPISMLSVRTLVTRSQRYFRDQQQYLGIVNGQVEEIYSGHNVIKAYNLEQNAYENFEKISDELYNVAWKANFISGVITPIMNVVTTIGYVAICVIGATHVIQGKTSIGNVQAFIQYSRQFTRPIIQTAEITNTFQLALAASQRLFSFLDEKEEIPNTDNPITLETINGKVEFKGVDFSYHPDIPLITNMNIIAKPGQKIAIVGPTGAGKTTIVNLLMRFYEIDSGSITIDDIDLKDMSREYLRNIFGMVLQDTWLFNKSIHDNIAYAKKDATKEEVIEAAKSAFAHHFISTLPDGYNTIINEDGSNISGGQKQLLTIARVILANPTVLILDEATSNVDTRTEIRIQKAMNCLMENRTSFVIAHRLSTIKNANNILVMNKGKIIEQGTHEELLAKNGFYTELYNSQFTTN